MNPTSRFYTSQRLRLHFADWGNEHKPLLLLVHGGKDHARSWDWIAHDLRDDYRVVAPDLRGHGNSAWAPGSMYSVLDSVLDFSSLLKELEASSVSIIGHSYGGIVAFLYAGLYPELVNKLVVIEGLSPSSSRFEKSDANSLSKRVKKWIAATQKMENHSPGSFASIKEAASRINALITSLSPEQAEHIAYYGMKQNEDGAYTWKYDKQSRVLSPLRFDAEEIREIQERINCPTLFLYGSEGWTGNPLSDIRGVYFRFARSVRIPDAGHWLHHDRPALFLKTVRAFLNE